MGSVERGVSICFTTLPAFVRQLRVSQRDRLAHRPQGTIRASPFQAKASFLLLAALVRLGLERSVISGNLFWFRLFWFPIAGEYDSG